MDIPIPLALAEEHYNPAPAVRGMEFALPSMNVHWHAVCLHLLFMKMSFNTVQVIDPRNGVGLPTSRPC